MGVGAGAVVSAEPALLDEAGERSPAADYAALRAELEAYAAALASRHEIVCIAKADLVPDGADRDRLSATLPPALAKPLWISSLTGEGLDALRHALVDALGKA